MAQSEPFYKTLLHIGFACQDLKELCLLDVGPDRLSAVLEHSEAYERGHRRSRIAMFLLWVSTVRCGAASCLGAADSSAQHGDVPDGHKIVL